MRRLVGHMAALACLLAPVAGCGPAESRDGGGGPRVVVSILPVGDLVRRLAPEGMQVEVILPYRASPDTWEASPSTLRLVTEADAAVLVGAGLDPWLEDILDPSRTRVLRITEGMELLHGGGDGPADGHEHSAGDPHVWLDPVLVRDEVVPRIVTALVALAPGDSARIEERAFRLREDLTALHHEIDGILRDVSPGRAFIASHGAWGYFARRYGLVSLGSIYERPGHEPSARSLGGLVEAAEEAGVFVVLSEPQLAGTGAQALAHELG
ncbi:MAG: metal ABC transporter substrate-binding protein, partial [Gemmatimonadota bacterium]|nr:metal ABC transporter substrate-binding protein [Gemmatimonadota bacterium]